MNKKHIQDEIEATKDTLKKLHEIDKNTVKGIEINEFVLAALEKELLTVKV